MLLPCKLWGVDAGVAGAHARCHGVATWIHRVVGIGHRVPEDLQTHTERESGCHQGWYLRQRGERVVSEKTKTETWQGTRGRKEHGSGLKSPQNTYGIKRSGMRLSARLRLTKPAQEVPMATERDLRQANSPWQTLAYLVPTLQ